MKGTQKQCRRTPKQKLTSTNLSDRRAREAALCTYIINELKPVQSSLTAMLPFYGLSSVACSSTGIVLASLIHQMEARLALLSSQEESDTRPTSPTRASSE